MVDVEAANITFVETQVRAGRPPNPSMLPVLPAILGNGVGGAVARVGERVDPEIAEAALFAPPELSGVAASNLQLMKERLLEAQFPGEVEELGQFGAGFRGDGGHLARSLKRSFDLPRTFRRGRRGVKRSAAEAPGAREDLQEKPGRGLPTPA